MQNAKCKMQNVRPWLIFCFSLFTFYSTFVPCYSLDLDTSIDDDIRRNYNPNKIEEDLNLPSLPKIINEAPQSVPQTAKIKQSSSSSLQEIKNINKQPKKYQQATQKPQVQAKQASGINSSYATLQEGTKVYLTLNHSISDRTPKGAKISLTSRYPVTTTYFTIPSGTTFYGEILDSHKPQLSGNGGLLVLNINKFVLNNQVYSINSDVTSANNKKIFFNNIKGKRKYISSTFKSMRPGFRYFGRMASVCGDLMQRGSTILLSPFPLAFGALAASGNVIVSPVFGLFSKGNSIALRENSPIEIILKNDVFIYKY